MSSLLRAKRAIQDVAGPLSFERGEFHPSDLRRRGETHLVSASVVVLGETVTGTGCDHLAAVEELSDILRERTRRMIREGMELC